MRRLPLLALPLALFGCAALADGATPRDTYAIVASKAVMDDPAWKAATVDVLLAKHPGARVAVWAHDPTEVRAKLSHWQPSFTAFVVRPEQAGMRFTVDVSHLCRTLDDDPYTDTFWGVVTGYDPAAARALAEAGPIAIERALDCAGCDLTAFGKAWRYTEDHRGTMNVWARGDTPAIQDVPCDTDNTQGVLERLRGDRVQFLSTSGHATQHDWQMGYCGPNMAMVHKDGRLIARDTKKQEHPAGSDEPKVYFANGNCLIGDIDKTDCMALSWMRDGGVRQFMGYTVTTWFGAQGWGTLGLFVDTAGLCTANEAFHFTNAGIVRALEETGIADLRDFRIAEPKHVNLPQTPGMEAWAAGQAKAGRKPEDIRKGLRQIMGNLHDRDTVCFYGDPALDARIADGRWHVSPPTFVPGKKGSTAGGTLTLSLRAGEGVREGTVWLRLPGSWTYEDWASRFSPELGKPDLCLDNMIRFPNAKPKAGETYTVRLGRAKRKGA